MLCAELRIGGRILMDSRMKKSKNSALQKTRTSGQIEIPNRRQRLADCAIIEVGFPNFDQDQLNPLIDSLSELLAKERLHELDHSEEADTP